MRSGPIGPTDSAGADRGEGAQPLAIQTASPSRAAVDAAGLAAFVDVVRSPPPAKAAIVIAAPAQARPPAARVGALTPPAVRACARCAGARAAAPRPARGRRRRAAAT